MWERGASADTGRHVLALIREGRAHATPSKAQMLREGPAALLQGWLPQTPLIDESTRVLAMGSCFAAYFAEWLAERGFNRAYEGDDSLLRSPLESPAAVAQQFRWAFGELEADEDPAATRAILERAEVMVITLGLAEAWFDLDANEPLWRVPAPDAPGNFAPRVMGVAESVAALESIERLRAAHMPNAQIVYTVSPVRFRVTFRPMHPLVANSASKAIVRAAVDEFLRKHEAQVGSTYFYFPSYEIVREYITDAYADNRHVHAHVVEVILDIFARGYTTLSSGSPIELPTESRSAELTDLYEMLDKLERTAEERLVIIDDLKRVCDERLALIERLSG
jgi:hypothetical protein